MNKLTRELYKVYQTLPDAEQQILQVLSVIFEPVRQGVFQKVLGALAWRSSENHRLLSLMMKKSLRDKLLKLNLVTYDQNMLQCHLAIIELLTAETVENGTLKEILGVLRKAVKVEKSRYSSYSSSYRSVDIAPQLRIAFHQNDEKAVFDLMKVKNLSRLVDFPEARAADHLLTVYQRFQDTDSTLLANLSAGIQYLALLMPVRNALYAMETGHWSLRAVERVFPEISQQHPGAACLLAELRIFQGRLTEAEALLDGLDSDLGLSLKAWICFLQGDNEKSRQLYQQALQLYKKDKHKRNLHLPGLSGIFYIFALLVSEKKQDKNLALRQLQYIEATEGVINYRQTAHQLQETLAIYQGKEKFSEALFLGDQRFALPAVLNLLHCVQLLWIGEKVVGRKLLQLIRDYKKARNAGFNGFAWQVEQTLIIANEKKPSVKVSQLLASTERLQFDLQDISRLLKIREPWEIILDALDNVVAPQSSSETGELLMPETDVRMTWRVRPFSWEIEPREQKLSKNGRWTKGRPVALKRLYEDRADYDYLTDQDHKICNQITEESYYDRGYYRSNYLIDHEAALLAAVGHPFIFMEDNLNTPVEVVKGEPCLMVSEAGKGSLKLTLVPHSYSHIAINKEADQKLSVVEFNPQHQKIAEILGASGVTIPRQAKQQVMDRITSLAPLLTIHSDIAITDSKIETVEAQQTLHFHLQPVDDGLTLSAYVQPFKTKQPLFRPGEGGASVFTEVDHQQVQTHRDLKAEREKLNQVLQHCPALYENSQYEWHLDDPETALETLMQLQEIPDQVQLEWPQGKKITLNHASRLSQMHINIRKSRNWFSLSGELQLDDDQVMAMRSLMDLLDQSPGRFIRLGDQQFLALTDELRNRLAAMKAYTSDSGQFHALSIPAIEELSDGMQVKASKPWKDQLARLQQVREFTPQLPSTLQAELRDYQLEGFQWLSRLAYWGAGACLADDMGLGKTMQALALILTRCKQGPTLVLAPTSVCANWESEAYRFAPTLKVKRFGSGDRQAMLDEAGPFDLIICSYGLLQSESKRLAKVAWHTVVADEAQAIKNYQAKRTKAAMELKADFRVITTGTPIENHLGELWSLFHFINPGLLGSLDQFNTRYANPIEKDNNQAVRQQLKNLITPFILRRLKSDVLTELPPRTEITLKVALSQEEMALYEAMRQQAVEKIAETKNPGQQRIQMLAEIMRLRRACCNPRLVMPDTNIASAKLEAFAEILDDLRANHHRALVFSQFVGHLDLMREYLDKQAIQYQYLDGSTPVKKRQQAVDNFQAGEGELFLISLKAGGSGLNLTAADYVIHLDPWWNPAVEDQASDRAHRIGQQRPVTVYRLVAENTIEEKIVSLHAQKRDLADSLLEGTEMSGQLSVDQILDLLKDN